MKTNSYAARPFLALPLLSLFPIGLMGGDAGCRPCSSVWDEPNALVEFEDQESESECAILFGEVGEPFFAVLEEGEALSPAASELPDGLVLDAEKGILRGVPSQAGFHQLSLLTAASGGTEPRVLLIDIVEQPRDVRGMTYATYVSRGVR